MKRIIFIIFLSFIFTNIVYAYDESNTPVRNQVTLVACESTSDVWVKTNDETLRVRLIAYDKDDTIYNNEINEFFCSTLKNANSIEIEYDIVDTDKYNRDLVHIFVDGELLTKILLSKGYGQVNYVEGEYKYLDTLCDTQKKAIIERFGIWNTNNIEEKYCESNVDLSSDAVILSEEAEVDQKIDINNLYKMIFISSSILILLICLRFKRI